MFVGDCKGRSGGLILLWRDSVQVTIQNFSIRHINAAVDLKRNGLVWKFTGIYSNPEAAKRKETWALLWHLSHFQPKASLCVGDFNEILTQSERMGAAIRSRSQMEAFQRALSNCFLCGLGFSGP
jgi:hypothetical protein